MCKLFFTKSGTGGFGAIEEDDDDDFFAQLATKKA